MFVRTAFGPICECITSRLKSGLWAYPTVEVVARPFCETNDNEHDAL